VRTTLGTLPAGEYRWTLPDAVPSGTALGMDARQLPTNYLTGFFAGPPATSPDYQALRVAAAVLSGQLFSEIRSKRNLTYAVGSPFKERAVASAGLYVSTVAPDSVLLLMKREVELLQRELVSAEGLQQLVNQFLTDYYLDHETNLKQADGLARAHLYRGDWRLAEAFPDEIRRVTPEDVRRVARIYLKGLRLAYIGDPRRLTRARVAQF
jgi:zinc protease